MTTGQVREILSQIEKLVELHGESSFKARAYSRASRALKSSGVDVETAVREGTLLSVEGIGKGIGAEIEELVETGKSEQHQALLAKTPPGLLDVLKIRGLGAKKVRTLYFDVGIESLGELEYACKENRVALLKGFGQKTQEKILAGIEELRANQGKFRFDMAYRIGQELLPKLEALPSVSRVDISGRLRRGAEEFDSVSFVVEAENANQVENDLAQAELLEKIEKYGDRITGIYDESFTIKIDVASREKYVGVLHQRSAPNDYRFMVSIPLHDNGYELTEDGLYKDNELVALDSEEDLYKLADLQFIPYELREGINEVRKALHKDIPELVTMEDMKGAMHVHSTWSDGGYPIKEIAEHVRSRGYRYLLMCDHSKAAVYANGLDEKRLEEQGKEIDEINKQYDPAEFRVLKGIECDILTDGRLDLDNDALAALDAVVISVHSNFTLSLEEQTARICRALEHPYSTILGHPTGRLLLSRKGYEVDLQQVITTAAKNGKAIELNANPYRLYLSWRMVKYAVSKGVKIAINPDAHSLADFENVKFGVTMARKGWLTPDMLLNAMDADAFQAWASELKAQHAG